jgi:hypothetical protein
MVRRLPFLIVLALIVVGLALFGFRGLRATSPQTGATPELESVTITANPIPFQPALVNYPGVDIVALVTVVSEQPTRWNTPDGTFPQEFRGDLTGALRAGHSVFTPVTVHVREYWENSSNKSDAQILVRAAGGSDGTYEVRVSPQGLRSQIGKEAIVLLGNPTAFGVPESVGGVAASWLEFAVFPVESDLVFGTTPCVKGQLESCWVPLEQVKARFLEAIASGRQYEIPQSTDVAPAQGGMPTPGGYTPQVPPIYDPTPP